MEEPIRREVTVDASPEVVWDAVGTPEGLAAWFGADVELEPRPGGAIAFRLPDGSSRRGVVERVEPPTRFAFRWRSVAIGPDGVSLGDASHVTIELEPLDDGRTVVTVTESPGVLGADAELLAAVGR